MNQRKCLEVVSPLLPSWKIGVSRCLKSHLSSRINSGQTYPDLGGGGLSGECTVDKTHSFTLFLNYNVEVFMAYSFLV